MTFLLLSFYGFVVFLLFLAYNCFYQYNYWKSRKMLHLYTVPFFGNHYPLLLRSTSFPEHLINLYNKFPGAKYFGMFGLDKPTIHVTHPDIVREICIKSFEDFTDHDPFVTEEMDAQIGKNTFSLKGQRWKEIRTILSPSYTVTRMKILYEEITVCSRKFVQYYVERPEEAKELEGKKAFSKYSNDVMGIGAFGVQVDSIKHPNNEFYIHGHLATDFSSAKRLIQLELIHLFPSLMHWLGITFLPGKTDPFFKDLIRDAVKSRTERGIVRQDMIHLLAEALEKGKVTMDEIIGQAFFFFLAGFDTSSSLMCYTCYELAAHQDVQERLFEEIKEQTKKDGNKIPYDSLTKMKYLDMVISEALRMYPSAPYTNRVCVRDHILPPPAEGYPEYKMDKGTRITIPIIAFHRDPKYFPDPDKFDPERFSDKNKGNIVPCTYMPFGVGPRYCLGNRFAVMETKVVIVDILKKFVIKHTSKSEYPPVFDKKQFNMAIRSGYWLKFEKRTEFL